MDELQARAKQVIVSNQLIAPDSHVIVGVSGGADSVALLHILFALRKTLRFSLRVAHLDHALRKASAEDAAFVRQLGEKLGLPVVVERQTVGDWCSAQGVSIEEGARLIRYRFFRETAQRFSAQAVALAHTADDQAETVLMRFLRGSGLGGLSAMATKRLLDENQAKLRKQDSVWLIRPLLGLWRREIIAYIKTHDLKYREDASNTDYRFTRNRIRHKLLPLLEDDYNPNLKTVLAQLADQSRWDASFLQASAKRQAKRIIKANKADAQAGLSIAIAAFLRQPKALQRQLVRQAVQQLRGDLRQFEFRHWIEIERIFTQHPEGAEVHLPGGVVFKRQNGHVLCRIEQV